MKRDKFELVLAEKGPNLHRSQTLSSSGLEKPRKHSLLLDHCHKPILTIQECPRFVFQKPYRQLDGP
ncbi:hypothetical protein HanIR_Chr01g0017271 [Helianthus annuus]|nr:hypothetical protein HanIR_Chr01g0017271 [Helianthus annuus]